MKADKQTLISMLSDLIDNSNSPQALKACQVLVHDSVWTRFADDNLAKKMKGAISNKLALLSIKGR